VTTRIRLETEVDAPPERVFDAARDIDLHVSSMRRYRERAVAGRSSGLIGLGETVTWSARHFGVRLSLTSRITEFDPPRHFRDVQVRGPFRRFEHDHFFEPVATGTRMVDVWEHEPPAGRLGRLVDRLLVRGKLSRLLEQRAREIRAAAES
jgi:ligand-binding SRPBCC domain-containing protein